MRGTLAVNGLVPGISIEEATRIVGKLEFVPRGSEADPQPVLRYPVSNHGITLFSQMAGRNSGSDELVDIVRGQKLELDGRVILELGATTENVKQALGEPLEIRGGARQYWSYVELGDNKLSLALMFDDGRLANIQTGWSPLL